MLKRILRDYNLLYASEDLAYFYKCDLIIRLHVDNVFVIRTKDNFNKPKNKIQKDVKLGKREISIKILRIKIMWRNKKVLLI